MRYHLKEAYWVYGVPGGLFPHQKIFAPHKPFPQTFQAKRSSQSLFQLIWLERPNIPAWVQNWSLQEICSNPYIRQKGKIFGYINIWIWILVYKTRAKYSKNTMLKMRISICICNAFFKKTEKLFSYSSVNNKKFSGLFKLKQF